LRATEKFQACYIRNPDGPPVLDESISHNKPLMYYSRWMASIIHNNDLPISQSTNHKMSRLDRVAHPTIGDVVDGGRRASDGNYKRTNLFLLLLSLLLLLLLLFELLSLSLLITLCSSLTQACIG
jgi:hypothetical protein